MKDGIRFTDNEVDSDRPPLLLLHGLGNSVNFWQLVISRIGKSRRVIAIDIPGFGASRTPKTGFNIPNVAADVAAFLRGVGVESAVTCGHSMGAFVALQLGRAHPGLVSGVVLIDGHLFSALEALKRPFEAFRTDRPLLAAVSAQFLGGLVRLPPVVAGFITSQPLVRRVIFRGFVANPDEMNPDEVKEALRDTGGRSVARTLCLVRKTSLEELMKGLNSPVSLVWGESDPLLRPSDLLRARDLMNVVAESEIPGVGHWPMLESPDKLASFLAGYDAIEE